MLITRRSIILLPVLVLAGLLVISEVIYRAQRAIALNEHRSELVTRASDARAVLERELYPAMYGTNEFHIPETFQQYSKGIALIVVTMPDIHLVLSTNTQ